MSRLIPVAESEAKLFSCETCDYYQWICYCYRSHNIFLWWSCGYYHWIRYYYRSRKIVLRWSCDYCSTRLYLRTPSKFTVLCKSNANKFRQNSWLFVAFRRNFAWNDISTKSPRIFVTPIVSIRVIFWMIIRFARWFIPNFCSIIRSSQKVTVTFRTIIHSSWKFDL